LSKPIFLEVLKKQFKFWWYECWNGKMCELQHHLNFFLKNHWIWIVKMDFHMPFLGDRTMHFESFYLKSYSHFNLSRRKLWGWKFLMWENGPNFIKCSITWAHVIPNISGIIGKLDLRLKFKTCNQKLNKKKESWKFGQPNMIEHFCICFWDKPICGYNIHSAHPLFKAQCTCSIFLWISIQKLNICSRIVLNIIGICNY
jgi:hypothetical protein